MAVVVVNERIQRKLDKINRLTREIYTHEENQTQREQETLEYGLDLILETFKDS